MAEANGHRDLALPGRITATSLALPEGLDFAEWQQVGETLGRIGRAHQWWIGSWINYGEAAYGEKYTEAIAATGYKYQALADIAWVEQQVEVSRRRENLSFAHHREVAPLVPREQATWLEKAEQFEWDQNHRLHRAPAAFTLLLPGMSLGVGHPSPRSSVTLTTTRMCRCARSTDDGGPAMP